ncbi:hypothetical protein [Paradesulfitobacterium aromaticivorans]
MAKPRGVKARLGVVAQEDNLMAALPAWAIRKYFTAWSQHP